VSADTLSVARQVADAVLYEGYVLFPYRASALKNRYRWQWGVVIPQAQVDVGGSEPSEVCCEMLVRAGEGRTAGSPSAGGLTVADIRIDVTARFLQLRLRQMIDADGRHVDELDVDGEPVPTWEEGLEHEVTVSVNLGEGGRQAAGGRGSDVGEGEGGRAQFVLEGGEESEAFGGAGQALRTTEPVHGALTVVADRVDDDIFLLRIAVRNDTPWSRPRASREEVLRRSIVGVHVLAHTDAGVFASSIDPPHWARPHADGLRNRGLYPVLVGEADDVVLAAPIILYDHPQVAEESPGPSFDATEVDELLALCVLGLTDEERRRARATDTRAAELIDRTDTLPASVRRRLHGAVRELRPVDVEPEPAAEVTDEVRALLGVGEEPLRSTVVGATSVEVGSQVRLRPRRRADAHDLFVNGRIARVERIVRTVDGDVYLAVTLTDDPAAELHRWYGRFQYFAVDEVEPLTAGPPESSAGRPPASEMAAGHATHEGG
jgi:hypothetical protein